MKTIHILIISFLITIMSILINNAFTDVGLIDNVASEADTSRLENIGTLQVGRGSKTLKTDQRGLWLGAEQYADAPFRVDMDGNLYASVADLVNRLNIGEGDTSFHVDEDGNLWLGNELYADAPFRVDKEGNVVIGGSDATSFHIDKDGNIWSGHASLASAPFKVENDGDLTAKGVTIKDSLGTSIIDSTGLISSANFAFDSVTSTSSQSTASTSFVDATGMSLTFSLDRASRVLFMATITGGNSNVDTNNTMATQVVLDGTQIGGAILTPGFVNDISSAYQTGSTQSIQSVASGSHTVKLQFRAVNGGTANLSTNEKFLGYVILGK